MIGPKSMQSRSRENQEEENLILRIGRAKNLFEEGLILRIGRAMSGLWSMFVEDRSKRIANDRDAFFRLYRNENDNKEKNLHADYDKKNCLHTCSKAWFYPELPWGAPPTWKTEQFKRGSIFLKSWDVLVFSGLIYVAFSVPYVVGFNVAEHLQEGCVFTGAFSDNGLGESDYLRNTRMWFAIMEIFVDTLFTLDIILNFLSARWLICTEGTPHWVLVDDLSQIRLLYGLSWGFFSDVLGQIPWQYMDCINPNLGSGVKVLRLFRLVKLFRLHRMTRMITSIKRAFPNSELIITSCVLMMTMCIVGHWMCCIWFRVGFPNGWVSEEGLGMVNVQDISFRSAFHEWITSFYWAMTTMSTIGYGDISATTTEERAVASVVMVMGCGFFAWATGQLTTIATKRRACSERFESKIEELMEFFKARDISDHLVGKARSYYMLKFPTLRVFDEPSILGDLPINLRKEILLELYKDVVCNSDVFRHFPPEVQREICYHITSQYFEAGAVITREGEVADALYLVRFGEVMITAGGEEVMIAGRRDVIGENALLGLSEDRLRQRTATATTVAELCVLRSSDVLQLFAQYPEIPRMIAQMSTHMISVLDNRLHQGGVLTRKDLTCPSWKIGSDFVQGVKENAMFRMGAMGTDSDDDALRTVFSLHFNKFFFSSESDAKVTYNAGFFIVVTCPDKNGSFTSSRGESRVFKVKTKTDATTGRSTALTNQLVKVCLVHNHNKWQEMAGLRIAVYATDEALRLPSAESYEGFVSDLENRGGTPARKADADTVAPNSSPTERGCLGVLMRGKDSQSLYSSRRTGMIAPEHDTGAHSPPLSQRNGSEGKKHTERGTKIWEGVVALHALIKARKGGESTQKGSPSMTGRQVLVELKPTGHHVTPVIVGLNVHCVRFLPASSVWWRVLPMLCSKAKHDYFTNKRREQIASLRRAGKELKRVVVRLQIERRQQEQEIDGVNAFKRGPADKKRMDTHKAGARGGEREGGKWRGGEQGHFGSGEGWERVMEKVMREQERQQERQEGVIREVREVKREVQKEMQSLRGGIEGIESMLRHLLEASARADTSAHAGAIPVLAQISEGLSSSGWVRSESGASDTSEEIHTPRVLLEQPNWNGGRGGGGRGRKASDSRI